MKRLWMAMVLALAAGMAWALPTVQEVQAQVQAGHYEQAQTMMSEVVAAKPGSARAHYLYAEILAHNRQFAAATEQARLARMADPSLKFTEPDKFRAFERLLEEQAQPTRAARQAPAATATSLGSEAAMGGTAPASPVRAQPAGWQVPGWAWIAGALALGWLAWRVVARSFAAPVAAPSYQMPVSPMANAAGPTATAPGYGAGYGTGYAGPMTGSNGNTALRTGMAVAGGLAAGVLIDQMMHRGDGHGASGAAATDGVTGGAAAGAAASGLGAGMAPGFFDADPSRDAGNELAQRPIDFGSGGNDWDSGGDPGGGSGDDGGW